MVDLSTALSFFEGGLRLVVRARPGLSKARPPRLVDIGEGKLAIEVTVAQAPEDGKANKAILEQIATGLAIKKNQVSLKSGQTSRIKLVEITGDGAALSAQVRAWLQQLI